MTKSKTQIDEKFSLSWKHYVIQSILATLSTFIVLSVLNFQHLVIVASIGSTAFIVFAMPQNITAKPRNVIGGHLIGLLSGSLSALIPLTSSGYSAIIYATAVGLSIFIMVITDTEHPPASGTALGFASSGFSIDAAIAVIISIIGLSLVHHFFKSRMKDLT